MTTCQAALATFIFFSCSLQATLLAQTTKPEEAAIKAPEAKSHQGLHVGLQLEFHEQIPFNEMDVAITFYCTDFYVGVQGANPYLSGHYASHRILNTSMSPLLTLPGDLVIRDASGKVVNRISDRAHGSFVSPGEKDYVRLSPGRLVGTTVRVEAAHNRETDEWLPNGEYTLQFEMDPQALGLKGEPRTPVVRSEPVKFQLGTEREAAPAVVVADRARGRDERLDVSLRALAPVSDDGELDVEVIFACGKGQPKVSVVDPGVIRDGIIDGPGHFVVRDSTGKEMNRLPHLAFFNGFRLQPDGYIELQPRGFIGAKLPLRVNWSQDTGKGLPPGEYTLEFAASERLFDFSSKDGTEKTISPRIKFRIEPKEAR